MSGTFSFSTEDTSDATQNTASQFVSLTAGQILLFGTTGIDGASYDGDTLIRLKDPNGDEVASNDDADGDVGSKIRYTAQTTGSYELIVGCYGDTACSGVAAWEIQTPGLPQPPREEWWHDTTPPTYYYGTVVGDLEDYGFDFSIYRRIVTRDQSGLYISHTISTSGIEPYWEGGLNSGFSISFYQSNASTGRWQVEMPGMGYFNVYSDGLGSKSLEVVVYLGGYYAQHSLTYVDAETPEPPPANKIPETFWVNVRNAEVT
jgi:hypothetical protein